MGGSVNMKPNINKSELNSSYSGHYPIQSPHQQQPMSSSIDYEGMNKSSKPGSGGIYLISSNNSTTTKNINHSIDAPVKYFEENPIFTVQTTAHSKMVQYPSGIGSNFVGSNSSGYTNSISGGNPQGINSGITNSINMSQGIKASNYAQGTGGMVTQHKGAEIGRVV